MARPKKENSEVEQIEEPDSIEYATKADMQKLKLIIDKLEKEIRRIKTRFDEIDVPEDLSEIDAAINRRYVIGL